MQVGAIDRRSALVLIGGVAAILMVRFVFFADSTPVAAVAAADTIPAAEKRLEKVRQLAATVPGKEELLKQARAQLAERESGVLKAGTEPQAQSQLLEIVQETARKNGIDARGMQEMRGIPIGDDYGEIVTTIGFTCSIEQLVNFLAALGAQPQILATHDIHVNGGTDKKKTITVRLSVSAIVPRNLIPKKGASAL
jgi:Type II secretion system (T2SS), protein M subtype b